MGTNVSRAQYEGLLRMDRRISSYAAATTATETTPQVGPITADTGFTTEAVIVASGTPTAGTSLELIGLKAGSPGVNRAGIGWRLDGATKWNGWDVPSVITRAETADDATISTAGFPHPQPIVRDDGTILIISGELGPLTRGVSSRLVATAGTFGATNSIYSEPKGLGDYLHPRGIKLPSGRVVVYHIVRDLTSDELQVRMIYTDDGTTFVEGEAGVLADAFDLSLFTTVSRLRVAYSPLTGQYLLTLELIAATRTLHQFASRDGVYFEAVGSTVTITQGHDTVWVAGYFVLIYDTSSQGKVRRLGSAFSELSSAVDVLATQIGTNSTANGFALAVDDTGTLYAYGGNRTMGASDDAGASWNTGAATLIRWNGAGTHHSNCSACWFRGQVVITGNQTSPAANVFAISALRMGGYADLTLPPERITQNVGRQMFWQDGWVGHDPPSASPFTDNSTGGGPTVARQSDGSYLVTNGAGTTSKYDVEAAAGAAHRECIAEAYFKATTNQTSVVLRSGATGGGGTHTEVSVDVSGTSIQMTDTQAPGNIGSAATITSGVLVGIRIAIDEASATAWYTVVDPSTHVRVWTKLATTAAATITASTATDRLQLFGGVSSVAALYSASWIFDGENVATIGQSMADDVTLPDHLFARGLPASGAAYVNDGVSIKGVDGPLLRNVELTMEITHPYPIENILPSVQPSPRMYWESASAAADQEIVLAFSANSEASHTGQDSIGVYLANCNVAKVRIEGLTAAPAYTVLADIDRTTSSLAFLRVGNTVYPDESNTSVGAYYHRDELAGSYFVPNAGSGKARVIFGNSEGHFTSGATVAEKRCVIYLADTDGTEAASGTTGIIVHNTTISFVNLKGVNEYQAYKITWQDSAASAFDAPPSGKFRCGQAVIGPLALFGKRQDTEYSVTREASVSLQELEGGYTRSRIQAPTRRVITIPFNDGVDVTTARGSGDSDWIEMTSAAGGEPIAHLRDLPLMLDGLLAELDGPNVPVVYLPNVPQGPYTAGSEVVTQSVAAAGGAIYGRIIGGVTQTAVVGNPMLTEVITGPSLTIREEL